MTLLLAVFVPVVGALAAFVLPSQFLWAICAATMAIGLLVAAAIVVEVVRTNGALTYALGGWLPPLGLSLRADGFAATMIAMAALVVAATGLYAHGLFALSDETRAGRLPEVFWPLLFIVWSAVVLVSIGEDLFNLYVALEMLTVAAVPLGCLQGRTETVAAALKYLTFSLLGSLLYLLGVALLYGAAGTLDVRLLAATLKPDATVSVAFALMIAGLLAKAALFPLHLWLPPAHAGAPPAASAVLSALVVKAPFILVFRLVFDVAPAKTAAFAGTVLSALGVAAIVYCSVLAARQARLKLMIAYSTAAQVGYLFLVFTLATDAAGAPPFASVAWTGGALQLVSHALAKAAMFMAAGVVAEAYGHDRLADLGGFGRVLPISAFTFALAGLSLVGLPPSGGFIAKCLLLTAAVVEGHAFIAAGIVAGSLLAAAYVFRIIAPALAAPSAPIATVRAVPRSLEAVGLGLAIAAVALGFVPLQPFELLQIGRGAGP